MTWQGALKGSPDLLKGWVLASGRDAVASTRASIVSTEGRAGITVFVALWVMGRLTAGGWSVWGPELGGDILPIVSSWYPGERVLGQVILFLSHVFLGVLWGGIVKNCWGGIRHFWPRVGADRFTPWTVGVTSGVLILCFHGAWLLRDLSRHPALYQETLLAPHRFGCWLHGISFGVMLSHLNGLVVIGMGLVLGVAFFHLIDQVFSWFMKFSRPTRVAIGVLGGALVLFALGIRFVVWTQDTHNEGPNLIFISIDGLRADHLNQIPESGPGSTVRWNRGLARAVPPSNGLPTTLATALSGRSPLRHGVRHDFPSSMDTAPDPESLPGWLRQNGWTTVLLADGPGDYLARMGDGFDVSRVAPRGLGARFFRRQIERSPHLLPYLSGRLGRRIPFLRGSPFLSDPHILVREMGDVLGVLRKQPRFFLWAHFSSPGPLVPVVSPGAAKRLVADGTGFFRRPGEGWSGDPLAGSDWPRVKRLYEENLKEVLGSLERLVQSLKDRGLDRTTTVMLWSPRPALLSAEEEADARALKGPSFFEAPLTAVSLDPRSGGALFSGLGRTVDVAPTVARLLGLPPSPGWEGVSLTEEFPRGEQGIIYSETSSIPFVQVSSGAASVVPLLVEDREAAGHLRVRPAWEDPLLIFRDRAMQWGNERLVYHPEKTGVSFDYYNLTEDPEARKNLAETRSGKARVRVLREVFFRYLSQESGWRPQNDFWIPEAFLREEWEEDLSLLKR